MPKEHHETVSIKTTVITVSTTRTEKTDLSGKILREIFEGAGIPVIGVKVVKDDIIEIRTAVIDALKSANCIIVNGGTGLTRDDYGQSKLYHPSLLKRWMDLENCSVKKVMLRSGPRLFFHVLPQAYITEA